MSATEVLKQARSAGVRIRIDGDHLALEGSAPPPEEMLELLARHKFEILTLLRAESAGWSCDDWLEFFNERAGIAEFDGGLPRDEAEALAVSFCVGEWLLRNPTRSSPGRCNSCGQATGILLPYLTGQSEKNTGYTWLHEDCSTAWHQAHRAKALIALEAMGIILPPNLSDDFSKGQSE